jgi:hypothetical protein
MFISCLFAVRDALRKTQKEELDNEYREDMALWAYEAEKKINSSQSLMHDKKICLVIQNNQVQLPSDYYSLICCSINGAYPELINRTTCRIREGCNCQNLLWANTDLKIRIDGFNLTVSPTIQSGTPIEIEYQSIRFDDEDGYPMIFEEHQDAVSLYIQWQLCQMTRDNRASSKEQQWYYACNQARARTNQLTKADTARLGITWWHR